MMSVNVEWDHKKHILYNIEQMDDLELSILSAFIMEELSDRAKKSRDTSR